MNTPQQAQYIMNLNVYQDRAALTAIYPGQGTALGLMYCALKLASEAGEVAQKVGKALRDDGLCSVDWANPHTGKGQISMQPISDERRKALKAELGGVLWYIANAAKELGFTLNEIGDYNIQQLADRARRGVLKGSGDNR